MALRALDLIAAGASYQDIAIELFGIQPSHRSWRIDNEHVRNRVRRIVDTGEAIVAGGYLKILQS